MTRPPRPALLRWPGLLLAGVLAVAWRAVDGDVAALFGPDGRRAMADFARGFWPPAHSPELIALLARPLGETVAIAVLGMSGALAIALPLSIVAASPDVLAAPARNPSALRRASWAAARTVLNLMRSVPDLIWALVFVRAVGMGPAAGILAIAVSYGGIVGKVFAEIFESAPRAASQALAGAGAGPLRAFAFGVVPPSLPTLASYALYRFDCALRASAVLGLVGAGGVGTQLELSLKMFAYDEVAAMVLALFALVAGIDLLSQLVRRRIGEGTGIFPVGVAALRARVVAVAAWAALAAGSAAFLELPWRELLSPSSLRGVASFAASMFPPDLDPAFLRAIVPAVGVTLATSLVGTAIAAALGLVLAWAVAYPVHAAAGGDRAGPARRALTCAVAWSARAVLILGRTLPELLWALVLIFAVGLGPFAGALALGIHTAGVLGRLYAEALEEVPSAPLAALRASGASATAASALAALPQAFPQLVAYTLYRWEVNIRASAVLGIIGAGGIGALLHLSLNLFHHHRTLTLVAVVVLLVTAVDLFSGWLRARILAGPAAAAPLGRDGALPAVADAW